MKIEIKKIILENNSQPIKKSIKGTFLRGLAKVNKPFKKMGEVLPKKPDISSLDNDNKSGPGQLFNYNDLLKDNRPKRVLM